MTVANSVFSGSVGTLVLYALYAAFSQNAVLGRGMGSSRLTRLVGESRADIITFCALLALVQVLGGALSWCACRWVRPLLGGAWVHLRPLVMVLCISVVFFVVFMVLSQLVPASRARQVARQLPTAAFNCCVLGTLMLAGGQDYTFPQALAFCLGSAVGYALAVLMLVEGERKLAAADLPDSFRGLPATLVYMGILSLLIYAFTGHGLVV